ncbi:MAG: hypothetical protein KJ052_11895, partial [Candidatus Hydrogenedentes bacterium]|nr:hypothetical protein [Candidatus Hydrogenedentota bacterium]
YFDVVDNHICVDYVVEESVTHPDAYTDCFIANAPQNVFLNHDTTQAIQVATANVSGGSPAGPTGATYDIWLVNSITNSYYSKCTVPTLITLRALALKQEIVTQNYQFIIFSEAAHSNPERVLAHEIGHVSGLEHNIVDTNLMAASTCDVSVVHGEFVKWDQVGEMASEKENYGD